MAYYLVEAELKEELKDQLKEKLKREEFKELKPFGKALTYGLKNSKIKEDGKIIWEEEDYCSPPLKEEKETVLDKYFNNFRVQKVNRNEGWEKINNLPELFDNV